jgi:hypothetical protein
MGVGVELCFKSWPPGGNVLENWDILKCSISWYFIFYIPCITSFNLFGFAYWPNFWMFHTLMFHHIFIQLRINFIFIYLEWQVSTCSVCTLQYIAASFNLFSLYFASTTRQVSTCTVCTLQYMMGIDMIFRQNLYFRVHDGNWHDFQTEHEMAKWNELNWPKIGIGPLGARGQKNSNNQKTYIFFQKIEWPQKSD